MAETRQQDVFVPEVATEVATAEFPSKLALGMAGAPFVRPFPAVDAIGMEGDVVKFPRWAPLGEFGAMVELTPLVPERMTTAQDTAAVQVAGKAVEVTDWADLTSRGDPSEEAGRQIATLASRYVDGALVTEALTTTLSHDVTGAAVKTFNWDHFVDAIIGKWGDKALEQVGGVVVHSKQAGDIMKHADFKSANSIGADAALIRGFIGRIGLYPVFVSDRCQVVADAGGAGINGYRAMILKQGALGLKFQRTLLVESDRDILKKSTVIAADVRFAVHLMYGVPSPVVKFLTL